MHGSSGLNGLAETVSKCCGAAVLGVAGGVFEGMVFGFEGRFGGFESGFAKKQFDKNLRCCRMHRLNRTE